MNLTGNSTVEVEIFIKDEYVCECAYSVKVGTKCEALLSTLQVKLGETRPIYIYNNNVQVFPHQITLTAIIQQ